MGSSFASDPEVRLMLRVQADEPGAYEELVSIITPPLLNFMYRQTGDQQLAEDLTQEVLMRMYKARHAYVPAARFRTWLYRIATNLGLNRLRYEEYRAAASLDAPVDTGRGVRPLDPADERMEAPSGRLERGEVCDAVRNAVMALPANQRAAVLLLRFEELSYQEIAEALDLSLQATKSLLNRAKEALRRALAPQIGDVLATEASAPKGLNV